MKNPIGFAAGEVPKKQETQSPQETITGKSLVKVYFVKGNQTLTYFNDRFDLKKGDYVFVEGKQAGVRGIVDVVCKNFKIKPAEYKKVIAVADTRLSGQLYMAGSHFVNFSGIPYEKLRSWYLPPEDAEEYEISSDGTTIVLENLSGLQVPEEIWERGEEYYEENRVRCLCVDGGRGRAVVEGGQTYEVEFDFADGQIHNLFCACPCGYTCKHEVAVLLQLKETLTLIKKNYADLYNGCFTAVLKGDLFRFAIDGHETGSFTL